MAGYVDGFVIPVPRDKLDDYLAQARLAGEVWKDHGALAYVECVADDVDDGGEMHASFRAAAQARDDETVIFSWIVYESREARDRIAEAAMKDPRLEGQEMVFDVKRMAYGGFEARVEL